MKTPNSVSSEPGAGQYEILKGARPSRKNKKHPIEKRALDLAKAVKAEWFPETVIVGRPTGKWQRKAEGQHEQSFDSEKPPLTVLDAVLIATPLIENFAQRTITRRSEAFEALYRLVRAHSDIIQRHTPSRVLRIDQKTVYQALRRARPKLRPA
jgi:hypothetical protein